MTPHVNYSGWQNLCLRLYFGCLLFILTLSYYYSNLDHQTIVVFPRLERHLIYGKKLNVADVINMLWTPVQCIQLQFVDSLKYVSSILTLFILFNKISYKTASQSFRRSILMTKWFQFRFINIFFLSDRTFLSSNDFFLMSYA